MVLNTPLAKNEISQSYFKQNKDYMNKTLKSKERKHLECSNLAASASKISPFPCLRQIGLWAGFG